MAAFNPFCCVCIVHIICAIYDWGVGNYRYISDRGYEYGYILAQYQTIKWFILSRTHKCWYMRIYKFVHADFVSFFNRFIMSAFAFTCAKCKGVRRSFLTFITSVFYFYEKATLWPVGGFTRNHTEITQFSKKRCRCAVCECVPIADIIGIIKTQ